MAYFESHFFSETLALSVSAAVIVPQKTSRQIGMEGGGAEPGKGVRYPVLFLLHGLSDDHTIWMRRTSIERYAAAYNLAVVMPAVGRSFYQDMASGPRYWNFVSEELPLLMQGFFPLAQAREQNFVAGLSMGGYGAMRMALACPERFSAAASLSSAFDIVRRAREAGRSGSLLSKAELQGMFGQELSVEGSEADLWHLAQKLSASTRPRPKLYLSCGTEDSLLPENRAFRQYLDSLHLENTYSERPGAHEWAVWDAEIQKVLAWLPLK